MHPLLRGLQYCYSLCFTSRQRMQKEVENTEVTTNASGYGAILAWRFRVGRRMARGVFAKRKRFGPDDQRRWFKWMLKGRC